MKEREDQNSPNYLLPPTYPPTPASGSFTPRRAIASFENLVALANYEERLRDVRKVVWRERGEPVVELEGLESCLRHSLSSSFRSGTLAFSLRACFSLALALIRLPSTPKKRRISLIFHAIFGKDTWRFAAMLATFVSTYKFLLNALPIMFPAIKPPFPSVFNDDAHDLEAAIHEDPKVTSGRRRTARLSLSAHAQMVIVRKRTRRWHAALAGAVAGGISIMWEKRSRRVAIAQQLFVRGLQGSYNYYTTKHNFHIPNGAVLVFSLACGQIMYAWLLRPDSLPHSYSSWITQASKVPKDATNLNYSLVRSRHLDLLSVEKLMARKDITPTNYTLLQDLKSSFAEPKPGQYLPNYAPCSAIHPWKTSCVEVPLDRFLTVFKWMLPVYGALHLIPAVLFKRKTFMKHPLQMLVKAALGTSRSSAFLGLFVIIYQSMNCINHQVHEYLSKLPSTSPLKIVPQHVVDKLFTSKLTFFIPGLMSGLALFAEERRRRAELAMYVLPKALESAWVIGTGKVGLRRYPGGEALLSAFAMGMVMTSYQNSPQHLGGLVRRILYQFIGPN